MTTIQRPKTGWFFEVYIRGPQRQKGWQIECGWVINAGSSSLARAAIKAHYLRRFDEVIQLYKACINHPEPCCDRDDFEGKTVIDAQKLIGVW